MQSLFLDNQIFQTTGFLGYHVDEPIDETFVKALPSTFFDRLSTHVLQSVWLHHRDVALAFEVCYFCAQSHAFGDQRDQGCVELIETLAAPFHHKTDVAGFKFKFWVDGHRISPSVSLMVTAADPFGIRARGRHSGIIAPRPFQRPR